MQLLKVLGSQERIVGGEATTAEEYPYVVSLRFRDKHICGGTIVSNRYILSAAHCLVQISPFLLTIIAGTSSKQEIGDVYFVQFPVLHTFNANDGSNDIALLRTSSNIRYHNKVQPAELTDRDINTDKYPVTMIGWGRLKYTGPTAEYLQKTELNIVDYNTCKREWTFINQGHICVGSTVQQGSCLGDSGGPLIANDRLIGIISFGKMCAAGKPDVGTRVFYYSDWIRSYMLF
uniref:Chymotrypsin-like protein n=1 Tax=Glyptapanteles indiensis TaxID=92994 RepID=B7S8U3_GLYIN|nr:chymotrypsin-like protein [Glyptapanteles indiensis]